MTPENGQEPPSKEGDKERPEEEEEEKEEFKRVRTEEEQEGIKMGEHPEEKQKEEKPTEPTEPLEAQKPQVMETNEAKAEEAKGAEQPLENEDFSKETNNEQGNGQPGQQAPQVASEQPKPQSATEAIEQGRIMFFYRPRVGVEEASSIQDIQRFYMLLAPAGGGRPRLAVVGKKRLPAADSHERFFGFIEAVGDTVEQLISGLGERQYETKTRGTRHMAAARIVAEGTYAIVQRGGSPKTTGRTNLIIKPNVPDHPGDVQEELNIPPKAGSYSFSVKNPSNEPRPGGVPIGLEQKADYTQEKREEFGGYAWIGVSDPSLLEFERCEFLLVAATEDVEQELGAPAEDFVYKRPECLNTDEECLVQAMKDEVADEKQIVNTEPAQTGQWA